MTIPQQFQRGAVTAVDLFNGTVTATLLSGPIVNVPFIGTAPELYGLAWFCEVAPGALMCMGSPSPSIGCCIRLFLAAADTIATATATPIDWDSIHFFKNWWDVRIGPFTFPGNALGALTFPLTGNPNGLQVPFTGLYMVEAQIQFAANATGARQVILTRNGTNIGTPGAPGTATANHSYASAVQFVLCNRGDTIDAQAWQNSGGSLATGTGANNVHLTVALVASGSLDGNAELLTPGVGLRS